MKVLDGSVILGVHILKWVENTQKKFQAEYVKT